MISPLLLLVIGLVLVIGGIVWPRMHAFLALALAAFVVGSLTPTSYLERHFTEEKGESQQRAKVLAEESIGKRLADGFGRTCGKVGILIAMAAIIGTCLMESGWRCVSFAPPYPSLAKRGHPKPWPAVAFSWEFRCFSTLFLSDGPFG